MLTPNLIDMIETRCHTTPEKTAYSFLDKEKVVSTITYKALLLQSQYIATYLQQHTKPGERVILIFQPGADFICSFFGCILSGAVAVPVCPPFGDRFALKLAHVLTSANPTMILSNQYVIDKINRLKLLNSFNQLFSKNANKQRVLINTVLSKPQLKQWHLLDNIPISNQYKLPQVNGDSVAFLQYTSGSTTMPKGVMVTHTNLLSNCDYIHQATLLTSDDRCMSWLPPYHDMGLIACIIQPLYENMTSILMSPFDFMKKPSRWLKAISTHKATVSGGPNFGYALATSRVTEEEMSGLNLKQWVIAFNGAEPIQADVQNRFAAKFFKCGFNAKAFMPCYGLAEATLMVSCKPRTRTATVIRVDQAALSNKQIKLAGHGNRPACSLVSCGKLFQTVLIVDPIHHTTCAANQIGEIWVHSLAVAKGYWELDTLSKKTFNAPHATQKETYLRTNDLGFLHEGELYVVGRKNDMFIINGLNYFPHDIERTVANADTIIKKGQVVAFDAQASGTNQIIILLATTSRLSQEKGKQLLNYLADQVYAFYGFTPYYIAFVPAEAILKTTSGKLARHACRESFLKGEIKVYQGIK